MPRLATIHECQQQFHALFPALSRPLTKSLAALTCGVVWSGTCSLPQAAASLPTPASVPSTTRRFQRLLANARLDVEGCQQALSRQVLARRQGRLDLLLDATTTGATARRAGTQTLVLALAAQRRALPLGWQSWTADQSGQDWGSAQERLFAAIEAVRPATTAVVVMADRGLSGGPLVRRLRALGWHYLLRVICTTRVQQPDGQIVEIGALAPQPGTATLLEGVKVYPPRSKPGKHWQSDWTEAITTNVVAVWRTGDPEAWLLITDLPAERRRCAEYRRRTWEEELFRDLKRVGWGWQMSRVRAPERVMRLLLVLAIATLWMLALGQRVVRHGWRRQLEAPSRRCYSRFQLGRRWVARLLARERPLRCRLHCYPVSYALPKLS
jgi:hypothetical protein